MFNVGSCLWKSSHVCHAIHAILGSFGSLAAPDRGEKLDQFTSFDQFSTQNCSYHLPTISVGNPVSFGNKIIEHQMVDCPFRAMFDYQIII
jgi:hypothetical protein